MYIIKKTLLLTIIFIALIDIRIFGLERKKKILVLHSYHQGLTWTDNLTKGIENVFETKKNIYEIYYEYLDTKRNYSLNYSKKLIEHLASKNKKNCYDVIIVCDNNALDFIKKYRSKLFPKIPIVFCGINNFKENLIQDMENITGITEKTDYKATIDIMLTLHPDKRKIKLILDRTNTGNQIYEEIKAIEKNYSGIEFEYFRDFVIDSLKEDIQKLDDSYLIYLLAFNRDKNNEFISYDEAIKILSTYSKVPIYGSWDFYFGKGIVGGVITSGVAQGEAAGKMALKILVGISANDIEIQTEQKNPLMFDYREMKRRNITIKQVPKNSVIINKVDIYTKYKKLFFILLISCLILVVALLLYIFEQRQMQTYLKNMKEQLEIKVKNRTKELRIKNQELKKISTTDKLTSIANRRKLDTALSFEILRCRRYERPFSLIMIDIDDFKKTNDEFGHNVGDSVLIEFAELSQKNIRVTDLIGRWGGEEFLILCDETNKSDAILLAEKLRSIFDNHKFKIIGRKTASFGVTSFSKDDTELSILKRVDKALYQSKSNGKNQVSSL